MGLKRVFQKLQRKRRLMALLLAASIVLTSFATIQATGVESLAANEVEYGSPITLSGWNSPYGDLFAEESDGIKLKNSTGTASGYTNFVLSSTSASAFVLEGDLTFADGGSQRAGFFLKSTNWEICVQAEIADGDRCVKICEVDNNMFSVHKTYIYTSNEVHLKLEVGKDKLIKAYVNGAEEPNVTYQFDDMDTAQIGVMTFNTECTFSNITLTPIITDNSVNGLSGWNSPYGDLFTEESNGVKLENSTGISPGPGYSNFVLSSAAASAFVLEGDLTFADGGSQRAGFYLKSTDWEICVQAQIADEDKCVRILELGDKFNVHKTYTYTGNEVHLKLEVGKDKLIKVYVNGAGEPNITYQFDDMDTAQIGVMTFNTECTFSNMTLTPIITGNSVNDISNWSGNYMTDLSNGSIIVNYLSGNNFVISDTRAKAFTFEADVTFLYCPTGAAAGLLFAAPSSSGDIGSNWNALHISGDSDNNVHLFNNATQSQQDGLNISAELEETVTVGEPVKIKIVVEADGKMTVYADGEQLIETQQAAYTGGYIGLCTYNSRAKFENIVFTRDDQKGFATNLGTDNWTNSGGAWEIDYGYNGANGSSGTVFSVSETSVPEGSTFVFVGDMTIHKGCGALMFGVNDPARPGDLSYAIEVSKNNNTVKMYKCVNWADAWHESRAMTQAEIAKNTYNVRVEVLSDGTMTYYLDNMIIGESHIDTEFAGGYFGVKTFYGDVTFDNVYCYVRPENTDYRLLDLDLDGASFVEPFDSDDKDTFVQAIADDGVGKVKITPSIDEHTNLYIGGTLVGNGETVELPLTTSQYGGWTTVEIKTTSREGFFEKSFTLCVRKDIDRETLYSTTNRPQFHYTPPYGYMNDPNGLLYNADTGEYHFFYQARPYKTTAPSHWGHAVTTDLVHFTEKATALYPDDHGQMWSGGAIIDYNNDAGLYDESTPPEARMILLWYARRDRDGKTTSGLAYTEDGGESWIKAHDGKTMKFNTLHPGHIDPKIVWLEDEQVWLLVSATGQYYTSTDLWEWDYQSTDKNWECPDIYPITVEETGETKWVRSFGGSFYRVGNIIDDNNVIKFNAESEDLLYNGDSYKHSEMDIEGWTAGVQEGVLYATQHYKDAPNDRVISMSWLRENVSRLDPTYTWTGAMTIAMEQTLHKKEDGSYIMYSYPVEEVKTLRGEILYTASDIEVTPSSENILADVSATYADIDGEFTLDENVTEFGFKLRQGDDGGDITIKYDVVNQMLTSDFGNSKNNTYNNYRTMKMELPADRKIDMRILLDNIIVEAFGNGGEAANSSVFTRPADATDMEFYTVGGNVTIDSLNIYAMNSAWKSAPPYTVSFAANGGTGTMADVTGISGDYTLPANGFTPPANMQFKAWSVGGEEKAAGENITVSANTTVTAVWEHIETKLSFVWNGDNCSIELASLEDDVVIRAASYSENLMESVVQFDEETMSATLTGDIIKVFYWKENLSPVRQTIVFTKP